MEPLAENRFTVTKDLFYEGMLRVINENFAPFAKKCVAVLVVAWVVLAAFSLITSGNPGFAVIEGIVLLCVCFWLCVYVPRNRAKRSWKAMSASADGELTRTVKFFPTWMEVESQDGEETSLLYSEISKILETKNLLVITGPDKLGIMVARDGFTTGSLDEVMSFIRDEMEAAS